MMKKTIGFLPVLALVAACSTSRVASTDDNVYISKAKAKEYQPYVRPEPVLSQNEEQYDAEEVNSYTSEYDVRYGDISYSARLDRFNTYAPWRNYYDSWYDYRYDPYYSSVDFYDRYYFRRDPFWSWNIYIGPSYPWSYNPYRYRWGNYWGIYSYYNPMPYYPRYYGQHFPDVRYPYNPRTYRPRPARGQDNGRPGSGNIGNGQGSRADRYNGGTITPPRSGGSSNAPRPDRANGGTTSSDQTRSRPSSDSPSRPARVERPSQPAPSRNERSDSGSRTDSDAKPRPARSGGN